MGSDFSHSVRRTRGVWGFERFWTLPMTFQNALGRRKKPITAPLIRARFRWMRIYGPDLVRNLGRSRILRLTSGVLGRLASMISR